MRQKVIYFFQTFPSCCALFSCITLEACEGFFIMEINRFFCVNAVICDVAAHTVTDILGLEKRF